MNGNKKATIERSEVTMNKYKYKGWLNLTFAAVAALVAIIGLTLLQDSGFMGCLFCASVPQLILFAEQRKLTEQQRKTQQNNKDERFNMILLKSGAITAAIMEGLTGAALIWAAFRNADDFAVISLGVFFVCGGMAFSVLQMIFEKKM